MRGYRYDSVQGRRNAAKAVDAILQRDKSEKEAPKKPSTKKKNG